MSLTTDPNAPGLGHGSDDTPVPQNSTYLVLSEEERAKGFVRPVRNSYRHVGYAGPRFPLRDLTDDEKKRHGDAPGQKYEEYPESEHPALGSLWTQERLGRANKGCGIVTTMGRALAETYARDPHFYGSTYCVHCCMHRPVGASGEFVWEPDGSRVGT